MIVINFKEQFERDMREVFLNTDEFAEILPVYYDGQAFKIPLVIDRDIMKDRETKVSGDHAEGIFLCDVVAFVSLADIRTVPCKGKRIIIGEDDFLIKRVDNDMGAITLYLEMYDE